ncbi:MAG: Crp/Fnr family transcriptional regulator [Candidatus Poribacteria bacterium]|nr:Crp/Fnr family transcriptional regulator [Candidatus Poribacteria bacterium]
MKHFTKEQFWYIKQLDIFHDLSEADTYALAQIITFKELKHEERICEEGVYLIREGRVKITRNLPDDDTGEKKNSTNKSEKDDNQETIEVLEQGEIFGVVPDDEEFWKVDAEPIAFAETLTEVCIGVVTIRDFSFFLKRKPHLMLPMRRRTRLGTRYASFFGYENRLRKGQLSSRNILKRTTVPDNTHANALSNIAFRTVSSRLALLILNIASVSDKNGNVFVHRVSIKRISKLIGSSTETIDTLLNTFKHHNVIDRRFGRIQIKNAWQLKKIADARMKTLSPPQVSVSTSTEDFDLEALINFQDNSEMNVPSTISSVKN